MKVAVFKVNQLGDNVVFLPVVQALRRLRPDWNVRLFTSPLAAELYRGDLAAEDIQVIRTAEFNSAWKRPATLVRLWRLVRSGRFDALLVGDDQGNVAHLLARFSGTKVRAGMRRNFVRVPGGVTHFAPIDLRLPMPQKNWEIARTLVEAFGGHDWPAKPPPPNLAHLYGDAVPVPRRVVIHCGASLAYQRWFPERYQMLANRLSESAEVVWIEQPHTRADDLSSAVRRVASKTLRELVTELRSASLFVGNNSGPLHLASAVGCPGIIISGPSNPVWDPYWYPERFQVLRAPGLRCLPCDDVAKGAAITCHNTEAPMACMNHWTVEAVYERAMEWLEKWRPPATSADA